MVKADMVGNQQKRTNAPLVVSVVLIKNLVEIKKGDLTEYICRAAEVTK